MVMQAASQVRVCWGRGTSNRLSINGTYKNILFNNCSDCIEMITVWGISGQTALIYQQSSITYI